MNKTVLVYLKKDNKYLMLLRNKKNIDINKNKWIGIGGHIEINESKEDALFREVKEETGLSINSFIYHGIVHFIDTNYEEIMYLFTSSDFVGEIKECNEGTLSWIDISKINELNIWEGDKIFLDLIKNNKTNFELDLIYDHSKLVNSKIIFN